MIVDVIGTWKFWIVKFLLTLSNQSYGRFHGWSKNVGGHFSCICMKVLQATCQEKIIFLISIFVSHLLTSWVNKPRQLDTGTIQSASADFPRSDDRLIQALVRLSDHNTCISYASNPWKKCPKRGFTTTGGQIAMEHYHSLPLTSYSRTPPCGHPTLVDIFCRAHLFFLYI